MVLNDFKELGVGPLRVAVCLRPGTLRCFTSALVLAANASIALAAPGFFAYTDVKTVDSSVALSLTTPLSGTANDAKQYGVRFTIPPQLAIYTDVYGDTAQRCPASAFLTLATGYTPGASAFSKANCPADAVIGTASYTTPSGIVSGKLYFVNTSPMPQIGVYFDTGLSTPYGRKVSLSWPGDGTTMLSIFGLPNDISSGLSLSFDNPSRPEGLPSKIFRSRQSLEAECSSAEASAKVYTYPASGAAADVTENIYDGLPIVGCGMSYSAATDTTAAGSNAALTLSTPLTVADNNSEQYGARFTIPQQLVLYTDIYGSSAQRCPASAFAALTTGYTPSAWAFNNANCPDDALIGTASYTTPSGTVSGKIYFVDASPMPQIGVYFDTGLTTPYGRKLSLSWPGDGTTMLGIFGLPKQASQGLALEFNNPSRPALPTKIWTFVAPGDPACVSDESSATIYTFPEWGKASDQKTLTDDLPISGC